MTRSPDRIRTNRSHVEALVAADTFAPLADRVERMLSHGRRITLVTRSPEYPGSEMTVLAGLTVGSIERRALTDRCVFDVIFWPGLTAAFGFSALTGEDALTEEEAWARFYAAERRYNFTRLTLTGGLADDSPARDDRIIIDRWNSEGHHSQAVVVFDPGPDRPQVRLNGPMLERLRGCAADTSSNWDGKVTIYPPEARELVAFIDSHT